MPCHEKRGRREDIRCPKCGGDDIKRLISRVHHHVSEADRLAAYDSRAAKDESFFRDSRNIGLAAKKRAAKWVWTWGRDLKKARKTQNRSRQRHSRQRIDRTRFAPMPLEY
jgi:hypothetical protein